MDHFPRRSRAGHIFATLKNADSLPCAKENVRYKRVDRVRQDKKFDPGAVGFPGNEHPHGTGPFPLLGYYGLIPCGSPSPQPQLGPMGISGLQKICTTTAGVPVDTIVLLAAKKGGKSLVVERARG